MYFKIFAVLVLNSILSGCQLYSAPENIESLKADIKLLKANLRTPPSSYCGAPGVNQNVLCQYKLIVKKIHGDLYQGIIDPQQVPKGYEDCVKFTEQLKQEKNSEWMLKDYECVDPKNYNNTIYVFKIEGEAHEGEPAEYYSTPGGALRKGHVEPIAYKH
jgi:hypothetical protein